MDFGTLAKVLNFLELHPCHLGGGRGSLPYLML